MNCAAGGVVLVACVARHFELHVRKINCTESEIVSEATRNTIDTKCQDSKKASSARAYIIELLYVCNTSEQSET